MVTMKAAPLGEAAASSCETTVFGTDAGTAAGEAAAGVSFAEGGFALLKGLMGSMQIACGGSECTSCGSLLQPLARDWRKSDVG